MNRILVDSSVWIDYLRSGKAAVADYLENILQEQTAVTCGVVVTEVIHGYRNKSEQKFMEEVFEVIPYIEIERKDWEDTAKLLSSLEHRGMTISIADGLIAQVCIRHNLHLLTLDKIFKRIERVKAIPLSSL